MNEPFWSAWEKAMARERRRRRARVALGWIALIVTGIIGAVGVWIFAVLLMSIFG